MKKTLIDAREVLRDIHSGMDDSELMKKYHLSTRGMQSLYNKLVDAGFIRVVNPKELINDIWSGMNDADLMTKYRLSPRGLERVLKDLEDFDLFRLASHQRKARAKITISTKEVVDDIRSGATELDLMLKYQLSAASLQRLFMKLLSKGVVDSTDLLGLSPSGDDTAKITETRKMDRCYPLVTLYVSEVQKRTVVGMVNDITREGVGVIGLAPTKGDIKHFLISAYDFYHLKPFSLKAICRWSHDSSTSAERISGFEITEIGEASLINLRDVIELATVTSGQPAHLAMWPQPVNGACL